MRIFVFMLAFSFSLFAGIYKGVIEPYDKITIKSEVSGRVVELDLKDEMREVNKKVMVIDHALESEKLKNYENKLRFLNEEIKLKKGQYERLKNLVGENRFTKERYKSEFLNLLMQKQDLLNIIAELRDRISKKEITVKNLYIKKFYVRKGEFVNPGEKLMSLEDQRKSRVVIFVDGEDLDLFRKGKFSVDGKKGLFYAEKIADSTDEKYLSLYRVELVCDEKLPYGKIVEVETEK